VNGGVLVNNAFGAQCFGHDNAVGRHLHFGKGTRTIVGVVTEIKDFKLDGRSVGALYMPFDRQPTPFVDLAIRTTADAGFLVNAVRAELRAVDPNQPMGKVTTMEDVPSRAVAKPRWYAILNRNCWDLWYGDLFSQLTHVGNRYPWRSERNGPTVRMVILAGMWPALAAMMIDPM
jgi:hypothetical protein